MIKDGDIAVLQFSGGKDSLACLYLLKDHWDKLTVAWVNTGYAFPETLEQMKKIRSTVPHFLEVNGNQPASIREYGYPADFANVWTTPWERQFDTSYGYKTQTPFTCCGANIWTPMAQAMRDIGATLIIRGQRKSEIKKSTVRNGDVVNGVRYWMPIEDWTSQDVHAFLKEKGVELPKNYKFMDTSLDCQHCTAFLSENIGKFVYMRKFHPELHDDVSEVLEEMHMRAYENVALIELALGAA